MNTELREWITEIWEYCQEHWVAAAAAAAVLLVLLVSAILVRSAKSDDAEDGGAPESESMPEVTSEPVQETVPEEVSDSELETESQSEPEPPAEYPETRGVMESLLKSVEAASGASGQKVESIELKIEKARLTIRYAGDSGEKPEELDFEEQEEEIISQLAEEAGTEIEEMTEADPAEEKVPPKRFGIENMNTARSGRVYTEEELLNQIRE